MKVDSPFLYFFILFFSKTIFLNVLLKKRCVSAIFRLLLPFLAINAVFHQAHELNLYF
jgi:hypothetical protein